MKTTIRLSKIKIISNLKNKRSEKKNLKGFRTTSMFTFENLQRIKIFGPVRLNLTLTRLKSFL